MNILSFLLSSLLVFSNGGDDPIRKKREQVNRILIIALAGKQENRKTVEEEIRIQLGFKGFAAATSYNTNLHNDDNLTKDKVIALCEKNNLDGVMIVRLMDWENNSGYSARPRIEPAMGYYYWGNYDLNYGRNLTAIQQTQVAVKSEILKVEDGKPIFEHIHQFAVGEDPEPAIGVYAKKLVKRVKKEKVIAVSK